MIDPKQLAASTLQLLQADPAKYKYFGVYWFLIKMLMKKFYDQNNLMHLGEYIDQDIISRMPAGLNLQTALQNAVEEYRWNAAYNQNSGEVEDEDGERVRIYDQDAGI